MNVKAKITYVEAAPTGRKTMPASFQKPEWHYSKGIPGYWGVDLGQGRLWGGEVLQWV